METTRPEDVKLVNALQVRERRRAELIPGTLDKQVIGRWIGVGRWKIIGATGVLVREIVHRQRRIVVNRVTCLHKHGSTLVGSITITNYALRAERRKALFSEVED